MKEYQRLHQLIISLNEKEVKYVSRRLKEHSSSKDDGLRILGLINKNAQIVSLEFIKHNTSLPANSDSLRKYLRRLYVRIIESLYLYIVEKEVEEFDQRSKKWDSVKRNLRFAEILFSHNNYQSAMELLDVVIKESQEYEYYDHLISALNRKLLKVVLRKESNYQELADQLEIASETQNYIAKSDLLLRSFNAITDPIQREKYQKKISIETVKIEQFLYKYNSVRLRINYIYLKLDSNQENVKYANRKSVLTALHTFLNKNSKKVKRNDFLMCYLNLAEMEFSNFNILQMSKYLTLAKKFLSDNSFNRFIVLELELKSALAVDDTKNLLALSEIFGRVDYTALSDHQRNKFIIYRALLTVYFGNSKSALHQLLTSAIKFDSVIDRFYNRIFEIQLMVEN